MARATPLLGHEGPVPRVRRRQSDLRRARLPLRRRRDRAAHAAALLHSALHLLPAGRQRSHGRPLLAHPARRLLGSAALTREDARTMAEVEGGRCGRPESASKGEAGRSERRQDLHVAAPGARGVHLHAARDHRRHDASGRCSSTRRSRSRPLRRGRRIRRRRRGTSSGCRRCSSTSIRGTQASCCRP